MQSRKIVIGIITIFTVLILSACAGANEEENTETESNTEENVANNNEMDMEESDTNEDMEGMDHSGMNHSSTGEIPEGLQERTTLLMRLAAKQLLNPIICRV